MNTFFRPRLAAVLIAASTAIAGGMSSTVNAATDGIQRLIAVSQLKANTANDAAHRQVATQRQAATQRQVLNKKPTVRTAADRLGNFEIQDLMSRYNQTETLKSSVQKKEADTDGSVIGKI